MPHPESHTNHNHPQPQHRHLHRVPLQCATPQPFRSPYSAITPALAIVMTSPVWTFRVVCGDGSCVEVTPGLSDVPPFAGKGRARAGGAMRRTTPEYARGSHLAAMVRW